MGEPTLTWTPTAATYTDDGAIDTMPYRGGYEASGQDTLFTAWNTWAAASGSADEKAIVDTYSSYAFTVWIDTNGIPELVTLLASAGIPGGWYPHQSGLCVEDTTYDFGGWCYFFLCGGGCANSSPQTFPASTGSDYIQTYRLTKAEFDTNVRDPYEAETIT